MGDNTMATAAEQQVEQEQASAAFSAGFDSVRGSEGAQPPEQMDDDPRDEPEAEAQEPESVEEEALAGLGLTASEIKSLLQRAAKVDSIEEALGKAHGKIGELNRTLQELKTSPQRPTPQAPAEEYDDAALNEFESTFPEFAPAVEARARRIAQEVMQQSAQSGQQADPEAISKAVNLAVMDATHKGWRETVASPEFDLWVSAQPESVRQTYATTWDHNELGGIVAKFAESRRAVADRATRSKSRLEAALTPDGRSSRVSHAASEIDAMQAGFDAVRNPRYYTTR